MKRGYCYHSEVDYFPIEAHPEVFTCVILQQLANSIYYQYYLTFHAIQFVNLLV